LNNIQFNEEEVNKYLKEINDTYMNYEEVINYDESAFYLDPHVSRSLNVRGEPCRITYTGFFF